MAEEGHDPVKLLTREEIVERLGAVSAYAGEVMLLGWDESHSSGMTAKFQFTEPDSGVHPLKPFTVRRGQRAGQRFVCLLFEVGDDEKLIDQQKQEAIEGVHKGEALARAAGRLCNNPEFHRYLEIHYETFWNAERARGYTEPDVAAAFVRGYCGVESRRALDHDATAAHQYKTLHSAFVRWREGG